MTAAYIADTDRLGLGRPDHEPLASETIGPIVELIARAGRARARLRGGRRRLLPRALARRRTARSRTATSTRWTRARASRAPTARRTRSTSRSGRRRSTARTPPGTRPWGRGRPGWHIECSAMAEELLGLELRHPRRRHRPRLPPPRERGGADARGARARRSRGSGCTTGCSQTARREDGQVGRQRPRAARGARRARARRRSSCTSRRATTASRSRSRPSGWRTPRARRRGSARSARRLVAGPVARRRWRPHRERVLRRAGRRLQHPRGAGRAVGWVREANRSGARRRRGPARDARRARPRDAARRAERRRRRRGARPAARARRRPRGADCAEADRLRDELRALGWEVRDGPDGPELVAAGRDRLRPQPGRARRCAAGAGSRRVVGARRARRGERAAPGVRPSKSCARADEVEARAAARTPTRASCAEVEPYPYADAAELLAARTPLLVALDEVKDPQNLGAVCRTAECAGATGVVDPRAARGGGHARRLQGVGGRRRAPRVARVRNLADFLAEAKDAGCWCYGAAADARSALRRVRTTPAGSCSCSARRARGCGRGSRRPATTRCAADARAHRVAQRQRRRGGAAVRDLAAAA